MSDAVMLSSRWRVALVLALLAASCGAGSAPEADAPAPPAVEAVAVPPEVVVLFLGDSLSAGYGLQPSEAFPALVERSLQEEGLPVKVVNAGVSGDTTAGGLRRLDWVLEASQPDVVVVELGANDGLRGFPPEEIEANFRSIVAGARESGARVLLTGMQMPPNYGAEYTAEFAAVFPRVAEDLDLPFMPFLLEGVAARADLNLPDGIHPNAEGHRIVAASILPHVREMVREESTGVQ